MAARETRLRPYRPASPIDRLRCSVDRTCWAIPYEDHDYELFHRSDVSGMNRAKMVTTSASPQSKFGNIRAVAGSAAGPAAEHFSADQHQQQGAWQPTYGMDLFNGNRAGVPCNRDSRSRSMTTRKPTCAKLFTVRPNRRVAQEPHGCDLQNTGKGLHWVNPNPRFEIDTHAPLSGLATLAEGKLRATLRGRGAAGIESRGIRRQPKTIARCTAKPRQQPATLR